MRVGNRSKEKIPWWYQTVS